LLRPAISSVQSAASAFGGAVYVLLDDGNVNQIGLASGAYSASFHAVYMQPSDYGLYGHVTVYEMPYGSGALLYSVAVIKWKHPEPYSDTEITAARTTVHCAPLPPGFND